MRHTSKKRLSGLRFNRLSPWLLGLATSVFVPASAHAALVIVINDVTDGSSATFTDPTSSALPSTTFTIADGTLGSGNVSYGGLLYSPDGKTLWAGQVGNLLKFTVAADGTLSNPVVIALPGEEPPGQIVGPAAVGIDGGGRPVRDGVSERDHCARLLRGHHLHTGKE